LEQPEDLHRALQHTDGTLRLRLLRAGDIRVIDVTPGAES